MTLLGDSLYGSALTYQIQIRKYGGQPVKKSSTWDEEKVSKRICHSQTLPALSSGHTNAAKNCIILNALTEESPRNRESPFIFLSIRHLELLLLGQTVKLRESKHKNISNTNIIENLFSK